jgi:dye decolorizing peroxidase
VELQRRTLVGVAVAGGALTACRQGEDGPDREPGPSDPSVAPQALRQRGVTDPVPRQRYLALLIHDLDPGSDVRGLLADLGARIDALGSPDGLTVTVGVGPRVVEEARGADATGAQPLPAFASDAFEDGAVGGDLLLQVCADRNATVRAAAAALRDALSGAARPRWRIDGYRGEVEAGVATRNVLGFFDGIAGPDTTEEQDEAVWVEAPDPLAGSTICVVRRIRLDHRRFGLLPVAEQEATFGRTRRTGVPLSGGDILTDVNLQAKSPTGVFDIANDAHVRRAHPLFSGAGKLMLRRSYSYRAGPDDQGLAFVCFQNDLQMFVRTQNSMDGGDRLLDFATTTGSASFLVLPGWDATTPLGAVLFR